MERRELNARKREGGENPDHNLEDIRSFTLYYTNRGISLNENVLFINHALEIFGQTVK